MRKEARIFVAGHRGMVGSAIVRALEEQGFTDLLLRGRDEIDLADASQTQRFFAEERPEYVFMAAARVGGILANDTRSAEFIRDNLAIQLNTIDACHEVGVKKLLFLGSSCIYPRLAPQPIPESALMTGPLEPTNDAYAVAKIAGITMCEAYRKQFGSSFISAMPTNLYGPGDNFDLQTSHVLPALIRRFYEARESGMPVVTIWGTGSPRREFLHVDDAASACLFLMREYDEPGHVNVGVGKDISILELAQLVADVVGYEGTIECDRSKPDGTPRKLLDVSKLTGLGWTAKIGLRDGIESTFRWYVEHSPAAPAGQVG